MQMSMLGTHDPGDMKAHFKAHKPTKTKAQAEAQRQALLAQVPEDQRKSISDSLLGQAMDMGMVKPLFSHDIATRAVSQSKKWQKLRISSCMLAFGCNDIDGLAM